MPVSDKLKARAKVEMTATDVKFEQRDGQTVVVVTYALTREDVDGAEHVVVMQ